MSNENHDPNEFDGIVEHNYPMPEWWVWSFLLTIIFGFIYFIHMFSGVGETSYQEHARMEKEHFTQFPAPQKSAISDAEILVLLEKADAENLGQSTYVQSCQSCHAAGLAGLVGPNLTDDFWIHGSGKASEIYDILMNGVVEKGMPAWRDMLKQDQILALVKLIQNAQGSNPANPKAPQGVQVSKAK